MGWIGSLVVRTSLRCVSLVTAPRQGEGARVMPNHVQGHVFRRSHCLSPRKLDSLYEAFPRLSTDQAFPSCRTVHQRRSKRPDSRLQKETKSPFMDQGASCRLLDSPVQSGIMKHQNIAIARGVYICTVSMQHLTVLA